jgi:hypothetical protein
MTSSINHSKDKINTILPPASIAAIMLDLQAASRCFSPFTGDRRLAAKLVMVLIILSTINQPFSESCGFLSRKRLHVPVFLSVPALLPVFRGQRCFFSLRIVSLILIYRHRVKSVCKSLNSHGELSLC